ncbi:MAG: patatin-like phospholipase family protein [Elusimicrobia bacterium]|nr:patatin-like phospholipase family protein [Elusimicrobiota bacterium]
MAEPLRRPLGLALSGGGALGAWQAGALWALAEAGLYFDKVLGFSAGALAGATYSFGMLEDLASFYRDADSRRVLRLGPGLRPPHLFSNQVLWEALKPLCDDAAAKRSIRCSLTVMTLRVRDLTTVYSRFTPGGEGGWDGPLAGRLVASCAIPGIFPAVRFEDREGAAWHLDGGVGGRKLMTMEGLDGCRDILVLEMVRPEEVRIRTWNPSLFFKLRGRHVCRRQLDHAVARALAGAEAPRVFRLAPSRFLDFSMLGFSSRNCVPALELGRKDAGAFLASPGACEALR